MQSQVALVLEQQVLTIFNEASYLQYFLEGLRLKAGAVTWLARCLQEHTEALAGVTSLLFAEQRVFADALTFAAVACVALVVGLLAGTVTAVAGDSPLILDRLGEGFRISLREERVLD